MTRLALAILLASSMFGGCVVYTDDSPGPGPDLANYTPYVGWADAGCYWDGYYYDDIWYFEADVDDPNGPLDVVAVYADVYDGFDGRMIDTFELFPTDDVRYWTSDWLGSSTWLDPYYGGYEVDIVAYDSFDAYDVLTIVPLTYDYY